MATQIQIRRGTAAQWAAADTILAEGELGTETDTNKFKMGNGTSTWTVLPYSLGIQGPTGFEHVQIKTPENISPADSDTGIGNAPVLTASAYYSLYGIAMAASQWQVSITADFATTVLSTDDVAGTAVTYSMASGLVLANSTYYWRTRYKDAAGTYSDWSTATAFTTAVSFGPTVIGEAYGGGYYAGLISTSGDGVATHYLIIAPKASGEIGSKTFGPSTSISTSTIDGPTNSNAINNSSYPAVYFCKTLTIGGYTDWYLPALDELEILYYNLKPVTADNTVPGGANAYAVPARTTGSYTTTTPAQTSVVLFKVGNSEAIFSEDYFWSSTGIGSNNATAGAAYFNYGGVFGSDTKTSLHHVRAVRRIAV